jgi:hypothetical protein
MNGQKFTPMLKAGGLWAKTSAKGGRYLTGRLGGVKVLILANKDRQSDNDPSHILYFVDGEQRRQGPQERGGGQRKHHPGKPEAITASAQRLPGASGAAPPRWSAVGQGHPRRRSGMGALTWPATRLKRRSRHPCR